MMDKNTIKRHTKIIALSVICLTIITLGTSYGIFFSIKTNSNNQTITTGTLSVEYGTDWTSVTQGDMMPMSDMEGLAQENSSLIYIQNTGTLDSKFTMTVSQDYDAFTSRSDYHSADLLVPLEYIKMAVYEYDVDTTSMTQIGDVINLGDLPVYTVDRNNQYNNKYSILFDTLGSTATQNSTKTYAVKVWLDEDSSGCISGFYVSLKIEIKSGVEEAKMNYNLSGTVKDSSGTAVSGATVSILNKSISATTSSTGAYALSGLSEGKYVVDVILSDGTKHSGTLKITEGSTGTLRTLSTSHIAVANDTYNSVAYTYATTPLRVKNANSSVNIDTTGKLSAGQSYVIPKSFEIVGTSNKNISNIVITLGTNNNIETISLG